MEFIICISSAMHLVCPPVILHTHCLLFSLETTVFTHEKLKTKVMQNFGEQTMRIMGDVQMVNSRTFQDGANLVEVFNPYSL